MTQKTVKWTIAVDESGEKVDISEAKKGNLYYCLACNMRMIPRKGTIKKHHYSHNSVPENYSYESELHVYCKELIYNKLTVCLAKNESLSVEGLCFCSSCFKNLHFNILEGINCVSLEKQVFGVRPDIVLFKDNTPVIVIEITVTHQSEEKKLDIYDKNKVLVMDIETLQNKIIANMDTADLTPEILLNKGAVFLKDFT